MSFHNFKVTENSIILYRNTDVYLPMNRTAWGSILHGIPLVALRGHSVSVVLV